MTAQVMGEEGARLILEQLEVRTTDRVVDMGAGTCVTAGMEQIFSRYSEDADTEIVLCQDSWRGWGGCGTLCCVLSLCRQCWTRRSWAGWDTSPGSAR